jgi:hypothetical protein
MFDWRQATPARMRRPRSRPCVCAVSILVRVDHSRVGHSNMRNPSPPVQSVTRLSERSAFSRDGHQSRAQGAADISALK